MPGKRKTSPRRVKRKTSPRRVKRKTSPRRVKRKTSPRRVKRKTSPRRKMSAVYGRKKITRRLEEDRRAVDEANRRLREAMGREETETIDEYEAARRGDLGAGLKKLAVEGRDKYYAMSPEQREAIHKSEEALIYMGEEGYYNLNDKREHFGSGGEYTGIGAYFSEDQIKFAKLLYDYNERFRIASSSHMLLHYICKEVGPYIVERYTSGEFTEDQTMRAFINYIRQNRSGKMHEKNTDLGLVWASHFNRTVVEDYIDTLV